MSVKQSILITADFDSEDGARDLGTAESEAALSRSVYEALRAIESAAELPEDVTCGVDDSIRAFIQGQRNGLEMAAKILTAAVGAAAIEDEARKRLEGWKGGDDGD